MGNETKHLKNDRKSIVKLSKKQKFIWLSNGFGIFAPHILQILSYQENSISQIPEFVYIFHFFGVNKRQIFLSLL